MNLINKIREIEKTDTSTRKDIALWLLNNLNNKDSKLFNIDEVAKLTYTSKASLVRFGQYLGYTGWREFFHDFVITTSKAYTKRDIDHNIPFRKEDNAKTLASNLAKLKIEAIMETLELNSMDSLEKISDILKSSNNIYIFTTSPNDDIANIFRRRMLSIGVFVNVIKPNESNITSHALIENDCAIFLSYSGNTNQRDFLKPIDFLIDKNVNLIGITSVAGEYILSNIKHNLYIASQERLHSKISSFSSETSINFLFDLIFSLYFKEDYEANYNYKFEASSDYEAMRLITQDKMEP